MHGTPLSRPLGDFMSPCKAQGRVRPADVGQSTGIRSRTGKTPCSDRLCRAQMPDRNTWSSSSTASVPAPRLACARAVQAGSAAGGTRGHVSSCRQCSSRLQATRVASNGVQNCGQVSPRFGSLQVGVLPGPNRPYRPPR
jgi:hypothetical protein